jgi:hypothetical protein
MNITIYGWSIRPYGEANSNNSVIFVFTSPGFQCGVGFLKSRSRSPSDFASSYGTVFTWDAARGGHFNFFLRHEDHGSFIEPQTQCPAGGAAGIARR